MAHKSPQRKLFALPVVLEALGLIVLVVYFLVVPRTTCISGTTATFSVPDVQTKGLASALAANAPARSTYRNCKVVRLTDWDTSSAYLMLAYYPVEDLSKAFKEPCNIDRSRVVARVQHQHPLDGLTSVTPLRCYGQPYGLSPWPQGSGITRIETGTLNGVKVTIIRYMTSEGVPSI